MAMRSPAWHSIQLNCAGTDPGSSQICFALQLVRSSSPPVRQSQEPEKIGITLKNRNENSENSKFSNLHYPHRSPLLRGGIDVKAADRNQLSIARKGRPPQLFLGDSNLL